MSRIGAGVRARQSQPASNRCGQRHTTTPRVSAFRGARVFVLALVLSAGVARAQDGGVYVYDRAALLLPSGAIVTVDAGVALDGPVALERANELQRLRAESKAPSWLTVALSAVVTGVWVADRVRAWTAQPAP